MSLSAAIYNHLINDSAISGIVSTRIYPDVAPSSAAVPYIVFLLVSRQTDHHLGGVTGTQHARVQIDSYESSSPRRGALSAAIKARCDGWAATRDGAMGSLDVRSMILESDSDIFEQIDDGSEEGLYRNRADYLVSYKT